MVRNELAVARRPLLVLGVLISISTIVAVGVTVFGSGPSPKFEITSLTLDNEIRVGQTMTISVTVKNNGATGTDRVVLKIDGVEREAKNVTIESGQSKTVTFTLAENAEGSHTVEVGGQTSAFLVRPLKPATFALSNLTVDPAQTTAGGQVTISVTVANTGDVEGTYLAVLKVDNVVEDTESVVVSGKSTKTVSFTVSRSTFKTFNISVDGLTSSFTVLRSLSLSGPEKIKTNTPSTFTVTSGGSPVSGASVTIGGTTKTTGADGTVTFTFDKAGAYQATVSKEGYATAQFTLTVTQRPEKVLIYCMDSKIAAYSWQAGIQLVEVTNLKENLRSGEYSGCWLNYRSTLDDATIFELSRFVQNGGRVFWEIWSYNFSLSQSLQNHFEISLADEDVVRSYSRLPLENLVSLWSDLTVGISLPPDYQNGWSVFLLPMAGKYAETQVVSESTGLPRTVSAYGMFGNGEVVFLVGTTRYTSGYPILIRGYPSISSDGDIDDYNNKDACLRVLEWLAGKRGYSG